MRILTAFFSIALLSACGGGPESSSSGETTADDQAGVGDNASSQDSVTAPQRFVYNVDQEDSEADGSVDESDEQSVQQSCPSDTVVWVNTRSGVYHMPGERWYGATIDGKYRCQSDADDEGDQETMNGQ